MCALNFFPFDSLHCPLTLNRLHVQVLISGISPLALWLNTSRARFLAYVIIYGMVSGGYSALLPTTITEIYGREQYSSANAAIYFVRGLGALVGAPVAGALLGSQPGEDKHTRTPDELRPLFNKIAGFDGMLLLITGVCVVLVRWFDARAKGRWKWIA